MLRDQDFIPPKTLPEQSRKSVTYILLWNQKGVGNISKERKAISSVPIYSYILTRKLEKNE